MLQIMFSSFCRLPSTVNTGLSVYRDKNALSHFIIAGGKTSLFLFMFFNLKYGLGNMSGPKSQLLNSLVGLFDIRAKCTSIESIN